MSNNIMAGTGRDSPVAGRHSGRQRRRSTRAPWLLLAAGLTGLLGLGAGALGAGVPAEAAERELNIYTSRHYQTDEALYQAFTEATGI